MIEFNKPCNKLSETLKVKCKNDTATTITHQVWHNYLNLSQLPTLQLKAQSFSITAPKRQTFKPLLLLNTCNTDSAIILLCVVSYKVISKNYIFKHNKPKL